MRSPRWPCTPPHGRESMMQSAAQKSKTSFAAARRSFWTTLRWRHRAFACEHRSQLRKLHLPAVAPLQLLPVDGQLRCFAHGALPSLAVSNRFSHLAPRVMTSLLSGLVESVWLMFSQSQTRHLAPSLPMKNLQKGAALVQQLEKRQKT